MTKPKRQQPERALHKLVADYLDLALTPASFWFPIPNGAKLSKITGAMLKRTKQIKAGVPDICIVNDGRACFLELKSKRGTATENQFDTAYALAGAGAVVAMCKTLDQVKNALKDWGIPLKVVRL